MKPLLPLFWLCLCTSVLWGQREERVVFYNVENLFDIYDDPLTRDDEFTPRGAKHWTQARYM
ncbi:MAG: endonuclease, partial [Odoribacter sp.]|nr:endonuclease [Odoribacter sp.]